MSYCRHCKINWLYSSQDKAMGACASAECVAAERAARMQAAPPSGHELAKKNATHVLDRPEARAATMTFQFSSDRRNVGVDVPPLTEGLLLEQPQLIFRPNKILLSPGAGGVALRVEVALRDTSLPSGSEGPPRVPGRH